MVTSHSSPENDSALISLRGKRRGPDFRRDDTAIEGNSVMLS